MVYKRFLLSILLALTGLCVMNSQEVRSEIYVDFRVNSTKIDPTYRDNQKRLDEITAVLQYILNDTAVGVKTVWFCGTASPEGSYEVNRRLAKGRMDALESLIRRDVDVPDSIVSHDSGYLPWDSLATMVANSGLKHKQELLDIINEPGEMVRYASGRTVDSRINKMKRLDGGRPWRVMNKDFFSSMRNAVVVIVTEKELPSIEEIMHPEPEPEPVPVPVPVSIDTVPPVVMEPEPIDTVVPLAVDTVKPWIRQVHLKTNAIGWGLLIANVAGEIDICPNWSFNLPIYYSAWNYFTWTVKFRTLQIQPELRYWFNPDNEGWFVGAHFGLAYYNFAIDGTYRTQDHDGKSPALGGGIAGGYRLPLSDDGKWKLELSLGLGVYALHHDRFRNYYNGLKVYTEKKTYFGLDQASVSFSYTFDLSKKEENK